MYFIFIFIESTIFLLLFIYFRPNVYLLYLFQAQRRFTLFISGPTSYIYCKNKFYIQLSNSTDRFIINVLRIYQLLFIYLFEAQQNQISNRTASIEPQPALVVLLIYIYMYDQKRDSIICEQQRLASGSIKLGKCLPSNYVRSMFRKQLN